MEKLGTLQLAIGLCFVVFLQVSRAQSSIPSLRGNISMDWFHHDSMAMMSESTLAQMHQIKWEDHPDEKIQHFFQQRRNLVETIHTEKEELHKAWHHLREVDGLKNEDVAVVVTSTSVKGEIYLWERIIPSARTWMKNFANAFVIVEDNFLVRYALRHCHITDYPHSTTFACHNEPTYILSRKCTNEYYGAAGPCCKVDEGFNFLINQNIDLFKHLKFVLHADDDTFFRVDQVMRWLAAVDKSGLDDIPIIANCVRAHKGDYSNIWHINQGCKEMQSTGWYQPMMLNHAALQRIASAVANYGITDTCRNFDVTHDVGVEAFAWIMSLNHIMIPKTEINGEHKGAEIFQPGQMIVHNIRHDDKDHCRNGHEKDWPPHLRYNQKVAIGCGDVDTPGPFHEDKRLADMYDAWNYFEKNGQPIEIGVPGVNEFVKNYVIVEKDNTTGKKKIVKILTSATDPAASSKKDGQTVEEIIMPFVVPIEGYSTTKHSKHHNIVEKWVEFKLSDCAIPGKAG